MKKYNFIFGGRRGMFSEHPVNFVIFLFSISLAAVFLYLFPEWKMSIQVIFFVIIGALVLHSLTHKSYLKIENNELSFICKGDVVWLLAISTIKTIEQFITQPYGNYEETKYMGFPNTEIRLTTIDGKNYTARYYSARVRNYDYLIEDLKKINKNIILIPNPHLEDLKQHGIT